MIIITFWIQRKYILLVAIIKIIWFILKINEKSRNRKKQLTEEEISKKCKTKNKQKTLKVENYKERYRKESKMYKKNCKTEVKTGIENY